MFPSVTDFWKYPSGRDLVAHFRLERPTNDIPEVPFKGTKKPFGIRHSRGCRAGRYGPKNDHDNYFHISRYR